MPQLDPTPWLGILSWSWFTFILFIPMVTSKYTQLKTPPTKSAHFKKSNWSWPWS